MDPRKLASELLSALRGRRSQAAFSRRLGYRSNVASRWESGDAFPTAAELLRAARRSGVDVEARLDRFFVVARPASARVDPCTRAGVVALLSDMRGGAPIGQIARQAGYSRFKVSRWLQGATEPRAPEFLKLVDVLTLRLADFLTALVDPAQLPTLGPTWDRLAAAREAAFARPWSHAVLRALELTSYAAEPRHRAGVLARKLGISLAEEQACLALLARAGQVRKRRGRWTLLESLAVDLRAEPERLRALKAFWLGVAAERLQRGSSGVFSFNVFAVSQADFERIRELHVEFYQQMRQVVAASAPSERVVLFSAQLLGLDE